MHRTETSLEPDLSTSSGSAPDKVTNYTPDGPGDPTTRGSIAPITSCQSVEPKEKESCITGPTPNWEISDMETHKSI